MLKNFSQKFYGKMLTKEQHGVNNEWFKKQIERNKLTKQRLYIPELMTSFDLNGDIEKIEKANIIVANLVRGA